MLAKKYRLPKNEIPNIVRRGKRQSNKYFDTKVWYEDGLENPLFTVIVAKKVCKLATDRNLIKRKLRAAIWELIKEDQFKKAKYVVLVRNAEIIDLNVEDLKRMLLS